MDGSMQLNIKVFWKAYEYLLLALKKIYILIG